MTPDPRIRNFCIIAHIDHGKSTLADRLLEMTNTIAKRDMHSQLLDTMELEQERGITIKLQPVRMDYVHPKTGEKFVLNLIDTPGHVDFTYEVSRSLAACEGAILVVDATQGIEAQTLANTYLAMEHDLEIIPVMNKIDLPSADPDRIGTEIENTFGIAREEILAISAKEGTNVDLLLEQIVEKVPPAKIPEGQETKALIFDSIYDQYKGVLAFVRVVEGSIKRGDKVTLLNTKTDFEVLEVGYFRPAYEKADSLETGEVGYIVTGLKSVGEARVGDTIWEGKGMEASDVKPLPGYNKVSPFVFASIFTVEGDDYPLLRDALDKLSLNDSALVFEPEQSSALGFGFRCGFLGLLHLEIIQERLEREYNLALVVTAPSVSYKAVKRDGEEIDVSSPANLPDPSFIEYIKEPWVKVELLVPKEYVGNIMKLCQDKRGLNKDIQYLDENRVLVVFEMPLANIVIDFYDKLKSTSSGYASMSYEFIEFRRDDLVKVDMKIAGDNVDALALITHRTEAHGMGSRLAKKLKEVIPKMQFEIAIQAAIGGKIIARETVKAMRKDVTAKLYGGDRTRKDKLLKKQKAGKKRMKQVGKINLPQEAFLAILKQD
jgi:GTP-binding protein LepA